MREMAGLVYVVIAVALVINVLYINDWYPFHKNKEKRFTKWMEELKEIAEKDMPLHYRKGDNWMEEFWRSKYFDEGYTPEETWRDYTTMVN